MLAAGEVLNHILFRFPLSGDEVIRADRRFAVSPRDVEHIARLAQPGITAPQGAHQALSFFDRRAKPCRASGKIAVMEVKGLDAAFDESPHEIAQSLRVVIDSAQ